MTFQTDGKKGAKQTVRVHLPPRTLQVALRPIPSSVFATLPPIPSSVFAMAQMRDAVHYLSHSSALLLPAATLCLAHACQAPACQLHGGVMLCAAGC